LKLRVAGHCYRESFFFEKPTSKPYRPPSATPRPGHARRVGRQESGRADVVPERKWQRLSSTISVICIRLPNAGGQPRRFCGVGGTGWFGTQADCLLSRHMTDLVSIQDSLAPFDASICCRFHCSWSSRSVF
jgi:hypothetical protein